MVVILKMEEIAGLESHKSREGDTLLCSLLQILRLWARW